jgi:hypothetical protein
MWASHETASGGRIRTPSGRRHQALGGRDWPWSNTLPVGSGVLRRSQRETWSRRKRITDDPPGNAPEPRPLLCAYLSAILLVGLVLNAVLGWQWADPIPSSCAITH